MVGVGPWLSQVKPQEWVVVYVVTNNIQISSSAAEGGDSLHDRIQVDIMVPCDEIAIRWSYPDRNKAQNK